MSDNRKKFDVLEKRLILSGIILPDGFKPKLDCKLCYENSGKKIILFPTYYDRETKVITEFKVRPELCECIKSQMKGDI